MVNYGHHQGRLNQVKIIKLIKSDYKSLDSFYRRNGLVQEVDGRQSVNPSDVYISKKDAKRFKSELAKLAKKRGMSAHRAKVAVGYEWLNLGPSEVLEDQIKPGFAIVCE